MLSKRIVRVARALRHTYYASHVQIACSRGLLDISTRRFDRRSTRTWEFSAFSQNGEDGLIQELLSMVREPNRYFLEIGASNGLENNSAFLAYVKKYEGVMVEGDRGVWKKAKSFVAAMNPAIRYLNVFVTPDTVGEVIDACSHRNPDLFSLDIDSIDFHVAEASLDLGLRPKVVCVEYNSAFGPDRAISVPLSDESSPVSPPTDGLYYGASIMAWRTLFESRNYRFVSVDSRGVNAFFVDPEQVSHEQLEGVQGLDYAENLGQLVRFPGGWKQQFELLDGRPLLTIPLEPAQLLDRGPASKSA